MKKIFGTKKRIDEEIQNSEYSINQDKFDISSFNRVMSNNNELRHTMKEGVEDYAPFDNLLQDTFGSLFKYSPEILKEFQMKPDYLLNRHVMEGILEAPKYKELRALTRLDEVNSTVGTEILSEQLKELLKKAKEQQEALQALQEAEKEAQDAQDQLDKEGEGKKGEEEDKDGKPGRGINRMTLDEAKKKLEEERKNFKDSTKKREFQRSLHDAVAKSQEGTQETSDFIENWGLGNDSSYTKKSYKGKMELLNRLRHSSKLKEIAKLAGRYKAIALQRQRMKVKKGVSEIYSVKQGSDVARLLPSELMKLNDPDRETLFFKDLFEGKTLQYETRSKGKEVKGPIICAIDESGKKFDI